MPSLTTTGSPTFAGGACTIDSTGSDFVTAPSNLLSNTQGWVAMRCRFRWASTDANPHRLFSWRDGNVDALEIYFDQTVDQMKMVSVAAPATENSAGTAYSGISAETDHTIIGRWSATNTGINLDGAAWVTGARGAINTIDDSTFSIGRFQPSAVQWMEGDVWWMAAGTGALADGDEDALHASGNTDPTWASLPATPTFLWTADSATYLDTAPASGFTNTAVPTVTGSLTVGGTAVANAGTWTPTPSSYTYYWHRADDVSATNLVEIGATGSTYTLAAADVGKFIRAGVIPNA